MNYTEEMMKVLVEVNLIKLKDLEMENKLLLLILINSQHKNRQLNQKEIFSFFDCSDYKTALLLSFLEGANLLESEKRIERLYSLTEVANNYIQLFIDTELGKSLIDEIKEAFNE